MKNILNKYNSIQKNTPLYCATKSQMENPGVYSCCILSFLFLVPRWCKNHCATYGIQKCHNHFTEKNYRFKED